jgi:hypothetical protein
MAQQTALYISEGGMLQLEMKQEQETLRLTQAQMAELFAVKPQNITLHLKNIYLEQELEEGATCKDFLHVQQESSRPVKRKLKHYNLLAKPVEQLINDNTLVALALLVAESQPGQKALLIRLIEHFLLLKDKES